MFDLPELKQDLSPRRWLHLFWSFAWKLIAAFCRAQTAVTQSQMPCFVWCCDGGVKVWKGCQGWTPSSCPAVNRTWRASFIAICLVKASFLCSLFHVCSGAAAPGMPFHIQHFDWMAETSGGLESWDDGIGHLARRTLPQSSVSWFSNLRPCKSHEFNSIHFSKIKLFTRLGSAQQATA